MNGICEENLEIAFNSCINNPGYKAAVIAFGKGRLFPITRFYESLITGRRERYYSTYCEDLLQDYISIDVYLMPKVQFFCNEFKHSIRFENGSVIDIFNRYSGSTMQRYHKIILDDYLNDNDREYYMSRIMRYNPNSDNTNDDEHSADEDVLELLNSAYEEYLIKCKETGDKNGQRRIRKAK